MRTSDVEDVASKARRKQLYWRRDTSATSMTLTRKFIPNAGRRRPGAYEGIGRRHLCAKWHLLPHGGVFWSRRLRLQKFPTCSVGLMHFSRVEMTYFCSVNVSSTP